MDYKQKYLEALQRAKKLVRNDLDHVLYEEDIKGIFPEIFPELKENEDERIRKEIIAFLTYFHTGQGNSVKYDDGWIAWLEKQKRS